MEKDIIIKGLQEALKEITAYVKISEELGLETTLTKANEMLKAVKEAIEYLREN